MVTIKRFKRIGMHGDSFNIPYGTEVKEKGGVIFAPDGREICLARSYAAHLHFARNDDGQGLIRGKLTHAIVDRLSPKYFKTKEERNEFWQRIWNDETAQKYRRKDQETTWLWSDDFYNAEIDDLKYIAELAEVKKGVVDDV